MRAREAITGSIIKLRRYSSSDELRIEAPNGDVLYPSVASRRSYDLWIPQPGDWIVRWGSDEMIVRSVVAVALEEDEPVVVEDVVRPSKRLTSSGA